jgi:hypothetical protein
MAARILSLVTGIALVVLGLVFLVVSVCAGLDPLRALAGCALLYTADKA